MEKLKILSCKKFIKSQLNEFFFKILPLGLVLRENNDREDESEFNKFTFLPL